MARAVRYLDQYVSAYSLLRRQALRPPKVKQNTTVSMPMFRLLIKAAIAELAITDGQRLAYADLPASYRLKTWYLHLATGGGWIDPQGLIVQQLTRNLMSYIIFPSRSIAIS